MAKKHNKTLAKVFHYDLYGKREKKYDFLNDNSINSIDWNELEKKEPYYFFVPKDFEAEKKYKKGFKINEIFTSVNAGTATGKDKIFVNLDKNELINNLIKNNIRFEEKNIIKYNYRLFSNHYFLYDNKLIQRLRQKLMKHLLFDNIALVSTKILSSKSYFHSFISKNVSDRCYISNKGQEANYFFPLYLYPDQETEGIFAEEGLSEKDRKPNLNMEIVTAIAEKLSLEFVPEKINNSSLNINNYFAPIDILDYIYAVLHSPTYRKKYKEFLKIDFPRVPYPKDKDTFWQLVKLGGEIRQIHLLEEAAIEKSEDAQPWVSTYPIDGDNNITTKIGKKDWEIVQTHGHASQPVGRIWINSEQYFENIPLTAWEFFIGGYQPAQKWLKDRKGRTLNFDDILHYQKIIVALSETDRLMKEIDLVSIEN